VSRAGIPDKVPVPRPLSVNVTPRGKSPTSTMAGVGKPEAGMLYPARRPTTNVKVDLFDLITGAPVLANTTTVNAWVALGLTPLDAVIVNG
jgi:hypothetical protein